MGFTFKNENTDQFKANISQETLRYIALKEEIKELFPYKTPVYNYDDTNVLNYHISQTLIAGVKKDFLDRIKKIVKENPMPYFDFDVFSEKF